MSPRDPDDLRDEAEGSGRAPEPSGSRFTFPYCQGGDDDWESAPWDEDRGQRAGRARLPSSSQFAQFSTSSPWPEIFDSLVVLTSLVGTETATRR